MIDSSAVTPVAQHNNRIALVLQGGGALGAYQAGVFQAMHENGLAPDWVVGTSIGAINAAIIAGNEPEQRVARLRQFWQRISHSDLLDLQKVADNARQFNSWLATLESMTRGVKGFFSPRPFNPFAAGLAVAPERASFYDTSELAATLTELIDFDYLNADGGMRLTVNAVKVTCGELVGFDNRRLDIGVEHVMASGALPPGFPPVCVDGELYWDGGLYSNTPLETVLDDVPQVDTLCFMVDLWSADGPAPRTLDEVQTRQKDVMFASRSQRHIDAYVRVHGLQQTIRSLYQQLPANLQSAASDEVRSALGCATTMHIVRLAYGGQDWHMAAKDINFSRGSIEWRWEQGYRDGLRGIREEGWLAELKTPTSIVVHDILPMTNQR